MTAGLTIMLGLFGLWLAVAAWDRGGMACLALCGALALGGCNTPAGGDYPYPGPLERVDGRVVDPPSWDVPTNAIPAEAVAP